VICNKINNITKSGKWRFFQQTTPDPEYPDVIINQM
jgi:hypothetical protein